LKKHLKNTVFTPMPLNRSQNVFLALAAVA